MSAKPAAPGPRPADYSEYIIRDAESYMALLAQSNLQASQLEPGILKGRHVRLGLPGGQVSYAETNLLLRGRGAFSNQWTFSMVLDCTRPSLRHGIEVQPGSMVVHPPGTELDGVYGRNSKIFYLAIRDDSFGRYMRQLTPQLQDALLRPPYSVYEPAAAVRQKLIDHFAEATAIIQADPRVRNSASAVAKFEEDLVRDYLGAVEQQLLVHPNELKRRAAAMVRQIDEYAQTPDIDGSTVAQLSATCEVPRRTLNRALQESTGMGPATYVRRVRLNNARRTLQRLEPESKTVTDIALDHGFWHLSRFAKQYHELFGESPHETLRRAATANG